MHEEVFAGLDISNGHLDARVLPKGMHTTVNNDAQGIALLIEILHAENPRVIVMEATGGYEIIVAAKLGLAGLPVAIVNTAQVRDFAKGIDKLAKKDAIDAYVLARFGQTVRLKPKPLPTEGEKQIEELVTRRRQLVDLRASEKNCLHRARSSRVRHSIETVIAALDQEIQDIDKDFDDLINISPPWRETEELLPTFRGVGPVTAKVLMARLPELGHANHHVGDDTTKHESPRPLSSPPGLRLGDGV